jgi:hypothetical protein
MDGFNLLRPRLNHVHNLLVMRQFILKNGPVHRIRLHIKLKEEFVPQLLRQLQVPPVDVVVVVLLLLSLVILVEKLLEKSDDHFVFSL